MPDNSHYVRGAYAFTDLQELLRSPAQALLSVSSAGAAALGAIGIATVFDLGSSWIFANAQAAANASRLESLAGRLGVFPSDLLKPGTTFDSPEAIAELPLERLAGIADADATALKTAFDITTIRDFAYLPARLIAQQLVGAAAGTSLDPEEQQSEQLRPRLGEYPTERVYYSHLVMLQMGQTGTLTQLASPISLGPTVAGGGGFGKPAVGAYLTYSQSWYAKGVTLGHMLHSLALAPGEATRIAVIDWSRRTTATATEEISETERLQNSTRHARAISEVQNAVAEEMQKGGSVSSGWASSHSEAQADTGSSGLVESVLGSSGSSSETTQDAFTTTFAQSSSWSVGKRSVAASMTQHVNDRTEQYANSVRNRRASAVREVSQSEHEEVSTRIVANYNHMHALTVQYYEVVQIYQLATQLHSAERCLFVPFELLDFSAANAWEVVERFRGALLRGALTTRVRDLLLDPTTTIAIRPMVKVLIPRPGAGATIPVVSGSVLARLGATAKPTESPAATAAAGAAAANPVAATLAWNSGEIVRLSQILGRSLTRPGSNAIYLADETEVLALSFNGATIKSVRLDRPGRSATENTFTVPADGSYVDLPTGIRLTEIEAIALAKTETAAKNGTLLLHCSLRGRPFTAPSIPISLSEGTSPQKVVALESDELDRRKELLAHLQANRAHYSQTVFRSLDSATLVMLLSPFSWNGKPLVDQVEPNPLTVAGNFVVLRAPIEGDESSGVMEGGQSLTWEAILTQRGMDFGVSDSRLVPVPTGGVFAEAVLGRSNSAEKLDITRFWNWQDSPIPLQPTEIAPVGTGSRGEPEDLTPGTLSSPVLNIVNPTSLPDPAGLSASLGVLASANLFRDMSGLQGTQALSEAALKETLAAASTAGQLASTNLKTEAQKAVAMGQIAADIAKAAMGMPPTGSTKGISADGARINHGRDMDDRGVKAPGSTPPEGSTPAGSSGGGTSTPDGSGGGESTGAGTSGGYSREGAYADRAAFGYSPDAIGATAAIIPVSHVEPELLVLCEELRQQRAKWEAVREQIVVKAQDEFVNTWNNGTRLESDPAMRPILEAYWQEPAFHGKSLPLAPAGWLHIPGSAWSAVFIAWVVDQAGGGDRFSKVGAETNYRGDFVPIAHWRYLAPAKINQETANTSNPFWAYPIGALLPEPGDIIVRSRGSGTKATWQNFDHRETHGDIIVAVDRDAGTYSLLGGNKNSPACSGPNDGCTVFRRDGNPLDADGFVAPAFGTDDRWFAIIRINTSIFSDTRCDANDGGGVDPTGPVIA